MCARLPGLACSGGYCLELCLDRLFAGPETAAGATSAPGGSSSSGGGSSGKHGGGGGGGKSGGPASGGSTSGGGGGALSLRGWTLDMLQAACVLAGCDFLPSLKGVSFRTAAAYVARRRSLGGALKALRMEKRFAAAVTPEYCADAEAALLAFKHSLGVWVGGWVGGLG